MKLERAAPSPERVLDLFDIPEYYVDTYGVHNVEVQHYHSASTEPGYLKDFRARAQAKSQTSQINVEFNQMVSSTDLPPCGMRRLI